MRVEVKGVKRYRDRHGTWRAYHRKSGTALDPTLSGTALAAEVERLDKIHAKPEAAPGSLAGLFASYRASPRYTGLAPRTKVDYDKCMDHLKPIGVTPLHLIDTAFMAKLRDKTAAKKKAAFTNHMLAMLSSAFKHGKEYGLVDANPCTGLDKAKIAKERRKENRPWSLAERENVLAMAPAHLRLPLALARFLGIRRGDILKLPRMAYRDGFLSFTTGKTGKHMKLPVRGALKAILDEAIAAVPDGKVTLLCLNSYGEPWTEMGFTASMRKFFAKCVERGIAGRGLTMHGLRHSVAADLRSLGYSLDQIKDYLGQETVQMAAHYSSSADVSGVLIDMADMVQGGTKRKRK